MCNIVFKGKSNGRHIVGNKLFIPFYNPFSVLPASHPETGPNRVRSDMQGTENPSSGFRDLFPNVRTRPEEIRFPRPVSGREATLPSGPAQVIRASAHNIGPGSRTLSKDFILL